MNKLESLKIAEEQIGWEAKTRWTRAENGTVTEIVDEDQTVMASCDAPQIAEYILAMKQTMPDLLVAIEALKRIADSSYSAQPVDLIDSARVALRPLLDDPQQPKPRLSPSL